MNNSLVVLTHKYPFEPPTEQFFHNELQYLQEKFDKIVIVPTSREVNKTYKYIISDKIIVISRRKIVKIVEFILGIILNVLINKNYWIEIIYLFKDNDSNKYKFFFELTTSYIRCGLLGFQLKQILRKVIDKNENLLIYSYWLNNNAIIAANLKNYLLKKKFNVKAIARAHGLGDLYVDYRPQLKILNESIDKIYAISNKGMKFLHQNGLHKNILEVNRLGVNGQVSSNKESNKFIIVSCSVLNANKRVEKIISSLSLLNKEKITWVHFGDGNLMQNIENMCKEKLSKNIVWELRGKTPNEEIIDFYIKNRPSLFINVSSLEGIPVSIMEAMSCSIPVIATDVGATSEIVDDEINGYLLKEEFADKELAQLIKYTYYNNNKLEYMRLNAYTKWDKSYNANNNYITFLDSCSNLLEN